MFEPKKVTKMIKAIQLRNKAQREMVQTYVSLWGRPERGSIGQDPAYEESLDENVAKEIKRQLEIQGENMQEVENVLDQWGFLIESV